MKNFFEQIDKDHAQDFSILLECYIEQEITRKLDALEQKNIVYKENKERKNAFLSQIFGADTEKRQFYKEVEADIRKTEMMEIFLLGFEAAQRTIV